MDREFDAEEDGSCTQPAVTTKASDTSPAMKDGGAKGETRAPRLPRNSPRNSISLVVGATRADTKGPSGYGESAVRVEKKSDDCSPTKPLGRTTSEGDKAVPASPTVLTTLASNRGQSPREHIKGSTPVETSPVKKTRDMADEDEKVVRQNTYSNPIRQIRTATEADPSSLDIETLPLRRSQGTPSSVSSVAGAYSVTPSHQGSRVAPMTADLERQAATLDEECSPPPANLTLDAANLGAGDDGSLTGTNLSGFESLVEAELVSHDVVHAEAVPRIKRRNRIIVAVTVLTLIAIIATLVTLLLRRKDQDPKEVTDNRGDTNNPWDSCFQTPEELQAAVASYFEDNSPNSDVSKRYGWPIGNWCVSNITKFDHVINTVFKDLSNAAMGFALQFQEDLGNWDMSNALELREMLAGAQNLSQSLGIEKWDTSKAEVLSGMFMHTTWTEPYLDLSSWNTASVTTIARLFVNSSVQSAGIANWDTSNVQSMNKFALGALNFNEDIGGWNTKRVTSMAQAFSGASSFNQDLNEWNTSSLAEMGMIFLDAYAFNQPLHLWDVSPVSAMNSAFASSAFNQDIGSWRVSNVRGMRSIFRASAFNQDLSSWDVSGVTDLRWAFKDSKNFSQNLCSWGSILPQRAELKGMFAGTACPNTSDPVIPGGPFCFNCIPMDLP